MGKIYKGQSALRIRMTIIGNDNLPVSLIDAQATLIKYKKPINSSGDIFGSFNASVENSTGGIIYYDIKSSVEINQVGTWKFWPWITFSDGRSAPGDAVEIKVYGEGE